MNKNYIIILAIVFGISSASCSKIYLRILGVKHPRSVNTKDLTTFLKKRKIKQEYILELDYEKYINLIATKSMDTANRYYVNSSIQSHTQPTQVIYFDKVTKKPLVSFFNCVSEIRGISNMTWNKDKELEFFPPKTYEKWTDSIFSYNELMSTFNDIEGKKFEYKDDGTRYLIILYYSFLIQKQSVNMIKEVNYNLNKFIKNNYQIYYVNMDNFFTKGIKSK